MLPYQNNPKTLKKINLKQNKIMKTAKGEKKSKEKSQARPYLRPYC
jgi:hypothetical protein